MRWMPKVLTVGVTTVALLLSACGGEDDSIAGTYKCKLPDEPDEVAQVTEIREDGTFTVKPAGGPPEEGTWSRDGDTVILKDPDEEGVFNIEGDRLVHEDGQFTCTPEG